MTGNVAELADLMRSFADGGSSAFGRDLTVVTPPDDRSVGVLAFAGLNVISVDVTEDWVRERLPDKDLSAPLDPSFVAGLAAAAGRVAENLDVVLCAPTTGRLGGVELTEVTEFREPLSPRLARALSRRTDVRVWRCPGGLLIMGRGVAGRWEASLEVEPALRGFGLGRGLLAAARGLVPAGEYVWAQVAPGNAASIRAALAAGFRPTGAEVLLQPPSPWPDQVTFGSFGWFADPGRRNLAPVPDVPDDHVVGRLDEPGLGEATGPSPAAELKTVDDDLATNEHTVEPLSVLGDPASEGEADD
jgi:GNAT superfamily N-acetyltransferase